MTTFPLRASDLPNVQFVRPVFARVGAVLAAAIDVFAEAELQASAAQKRYPFASW
ncbi:MAG TPA: hypothetical protein VL048_12355 [Xanthobacteraceae bacterium]|nr:hypothetical protein [Xanthobacteraceae bacterium]